MAVTGLTLRLAQQLRSQLGQITDQQTRDLVKAWAQAWDEVAPDLNTALLDVTTLGSHDGVIGRMQLMRSSRLWQALQVIADHLGQLAHESGIRISGDLSAIVREAGEAQAALLRSQVPAGAPLDFGGWDRVNPYQIAAIVDRSTQQITSLTRPLAPEAYEAVKAELFRGVAARSNPRDTAGRMVKRAEYRFNGGLTRALTIARTETLSAHRAASTVARSQNLGVVTGWRWLTTLDVRTCPACLSKNGSVYPATEDGPAGHPNCRCSACPITPSWRDLGFDIDEPEDIFPDAKAWFDNLPQADQVRVMGLERLALLQAGRITWDDLATLQHNPNWRDSWQVTPLKALASA